MYNLLILMLFIVSVLSLEYGGENRTEDGQTRGKKVLSVFTVVKFPNIACSSSTTGRNGTCYTNSECSSKGGSASGSCASSFGVCCVFEKSCGAGTIAENCTYFTSSDRTLGGSCSLTICKCSSDVCQLRLDFESFTLNNPVTVTTLTSLIAVGAGASSSLGKCAVDSFTVSAPGGKAPPSLCGVNTGYHMYVPASDSCNVLGSQFGSASTATTSAFTIKVTQVECNSKTRAPDGCLQYFTGTTGTIETFNYNNLGGVLLTNQDYSACVRSERTMCTICYYAETTSFKMNVFNGIAANGAKGFDTLCGYEGHNAEATSGGGYDYIEIPNGQCDSPYPATDIEATETNDRYCGTSFVCMGAAGAASGEANAKNTVCSSTRPFKLSVHSDDLEYGNPAADSEGSLANNRGFQIKYFMRDACLTKTPA